ncbi:MAG: glycosyltransferase [Bacteroidales bacterium]|jgi:glycosyltransferase involved in cell wall biosynthesis|nr:glycosyltransferase [Bacteroidales bacterium]MBP7874210.1 glycosyltransferase [Bacteroidales bacterium]MCZ2282636.1 glycosyltransferase [Bacteroidales bacterium]
MIDALFESLLQQQQFSLFFYTFVLLLFIQLIFFLVCFNRLNSRKLQKEIDVKQSVSVVLVTSNQYNDLRKLLPEILNQSYSNYEVVVVDDSSEDGSDVLLERFSEQYSHLKVVNMHQHLNWFKGNEFPISIGIKSAVNDWILLTETTCIPRSSHWISEMMKKANFPTQIVLARSSFATSSKINIWYRFARFYNSLINLSFAISKISFKGSTQNLLFSRKLFFDQKGFVSHYTIKGGVGELFVSEAATLSNVSVQISPKSVVDYVKSTSFRKWIIKEHTNLDIERRINLKQRIPFLLYFNSLFIFYLVFGILMINNLHWQVILSLFSIRLVSQFFIFHRAQKRLSEQRLLLLMPVFEIALLVIHFLIRFRLIFIKKGVWV